jgi:hypothetical protein
MEQFTIDDYETLVTFLEAVRYQLVANDDDRENVRGEKTYKKTVLALTEFLSDTELDRNTVERASREAIRRINIRIEDEKLWQFNLTDEQREIIIGRFVSSFMRMQKYHLNGQESLFTREDDDQRYFINALKEMRIPNAIIESILSEVQLRLKKKISNN